MKKEVPEGFEVRRKQGRDEEEGLMRVELVFTLEEWDKIEDAAYAVPVYPKRWLKEVILHRVEHGSSSI